MPFRTTFLPFFSEIIKFLYVNIKYGMKNWLVITIIVYLLAQAQGDQINLIL